VLSGLSPDGSTGSTRGSFGATNRDSDVISGGFGRRGSLNERGRGFSNVRTQQRLASQTRVPGQSLRGDGGTRTVSAAFLGEEISITADPATNSLVIFASKSD